MSCTHVGCVAVGDGDCHLDADGWMINITREQHDRVRAAIGCPANELAQAIVDSTDRGRVLVVSLLERLANPSLGTKNRKDAEKLLERFRRVGVPREPWKER